MKEVRAGLVLSLPVLLALEAAVPSDTLLGVLALVVGATLASLYVR